MRRSFRATLQNKIYYKENEENCVIYTLLKPLDTYYTLGHVLSTCTHKGMGKSIEKL